jgi:hypothetical protein
VRIETKQLEGRDHYVVPMVMLLEGVFAGSRGPLLYTADELRASVPQWNGKPVVVYHPGLYPSNGFAGDPEVFNRQKIGTVFNTRFDSKNRLLADAWLDVARVRAVDHRIERAIQARQMMEVSTGLVTDNRGDAGTYNGREYHSVARSLKPDHLAVLPDRVGACSIADGAGLIRNDGSAAMHVGGIVQISAERPRHDPLPLPTLSFETAATGRSNATAADAAPTAVGGASTSHGKLGGHAPLLLPSLFEEAR